MEEGTRGDTVFFFIQVERVYCIFLIHLLHLMRRSDKMKILIINGAEKRPEYGRGQLSATMCQLFELYFRNTHEIIRTDIADGYQIDVERKKLASAELVIFQFPVYWFSVPSSTKKYFDDVFLPLHTTFQYIGLKHIGTLSLHDVMRNPNMEAYTKQFADFIAHIEWSK